MSASLVGSEMCIRDRDPAAPHIAPPHYMQMLALEDGSGPSPERWQHIREQLRLFDEHLRRSKASSSVGPAHRYKIPPLKKHKRR
eukprot:3591925-Alexandrium_andersonii.AAC.1